MKSSLLLSDFTCIDHAYVDNQGKIIGGSFHASAVITGNVTEDENVVIDFSRCKKLVKGFIDDFDIGYDHKLWIMKDSKVSVNIKNNQFIVISPQFIASTDLYALKTLSCKYDIYEIEKELSNYLSHHLTKEMGSEIKAQVTLTKDFHALDKSKRTYPFRYAHGLKNSSSKPCQSLVHGHYSYIQLLGYDYKSLESDIAKELGFFISTLLDNSYFIFSQNVYHKDDSSIALKYVSKNRGQFSLTIKHKNNKTIVLDTETTIEHICEYVKTEFYTDLVKVGAKYLVVSEGLSKGCLVSI